MSFYPVIPRENGENCINFQEISLINAWGVVKNAIQDRVLSLPFTFYFLLYEDAITVTNATFALV